jgi:hypothetical protein
MAVRTEEPPGWCLLDQGSAFDPPFRSCLWELRPFPIEADVAWDCLLKCPASRPGGALNQLVGHTARFEHAAELLGRLGCQSSLNVLEVSIKIKFITMIKK